MNRRGFILSLLIAAGAGTSLFLMQRPLICTRGRVALEAIKAWQSAL